MQAHSRGITLDQLRTPAGGDTDAIPGTSTPTPTLTHSEFTAAPDSLALLNRMLQGLTSTGTQDTLARELATLAKEAMGMDLCMVMLADRGEDLPASRHLSIRASSPDLNGQILAVPPLEVKPTLWEKLRQPAVPGRLPTLDLHEQDALNPLDNVAYGSLFILPLLAGTELVGLLYGYTSSVRDLSAQEVLILQTISSYAAMSIANRVMLDATQSGAPLRAFFDDLLSDSPTQEDSLRGRAAALGYDVTLPSLVVLVELAGTPGENEQHIQLARYDRLQTKNDRQAIFSHALAHLHIRLQEQYPVSLIDAREHQLHCIISTELDPSRLGVWLTALLQQIEGDFDTQFFAGISTLCSGLGDYRRGFAEAREALRIGECLRSQAGCLQFGQLGAYRYLYPFAHGRRLGDLGDPFLDHIEAIARYDREHKRGNLLRSLETYLSLGGNIKEAAEQLKVHRNTLTQRLERIQSLCGVNLDKYNERFTLQVALMVYRLIEQL